MASLGPGYGIFVVSIRLNTGLRYDPLSVQLGPFRVTLFLGVIPQAAVRAAGLDGPF